MGTITDIGKAIETTLKAAAPTFDVPVDIVRTYEPTNRLLERGPARVEIVPVQMAESSRESRDTEADTVEFVVGIVRHVATNNIADVDELVDLAEAVRASLQFVDQAGGRFLSSTLATILSLENYQSGRQFVAVVSLNYWTC